MARRCGTLQTPLWMAMASTLAAGERRLHSREGAADPGALVLGRLEAAGLHQPVGVLVPAAVREIVAEHSRGGLRLLRDAERHIGLSEPEQRFFHVARGLILRHDDLEPVDPAGELSLAKIIETDRHLLAGQL